MSTTSPNALELYVPYSAEDSEGDVAKRTLNSLRFLAVKNLMKNQRLSRHIADVGWGLILSQLKYKTSWSAGSLLVAADRFSPSSKTCSACGAVKAKLRLAERVFSCDDADCGLVMDRDLNAALNLAGLAQRRAAAEGIQSYVARTGRFTLNARGGHVSLA